MRFFLFLLMCLVSTPAFAGQTDARTTAIANGCKPTKIEVVKQTPAETVYTATCESKTTPPPSNPPTLHVVCRGKLCVTRK